MKETTEFRILAKHAKLLFAQHKGRDLGSVIKVSIHNLDPRYPEIGVLQKRLREKGSFFFSNWYIDRKYTKKELDSAESFFLRILQRFEPSGEECGTMYDESSACPLCRAGAKQLNPLHLRRSSIPKTKDFCCTIADNEVIISKKATELFQKNDVTGIEYGPVFLDKKLQKPSADWHQLVIKSNPVEVSSRTKFGLTPFEDDTRNEYLCPNGHKGGLNILSELYLNQESRGTADFVVTDKFIGSRGGLVRPHRLIVVSQKVRRIVEQNKLKGCGLEVAYLV